MVNSHPGILPFTVLIHIWVVATQIFLEFSPRTLGKISNLTHIFQMGWFNHQPVYACVLLCLQENLLAVSVPIVAAGNFEDYAEYGGQGASDVWHCKHHGVGVNPIPIFMLKIAYIFTYV